ncbi:MAG TPA: sensor histidine kinase, partial [Parasegetibacter sp.]
AMMLVNVQLFQHEDGARLKLKPFTTELCGHLKKIYDGNGMVNIEIEGDDDIVLDSDHAISFGLIITELLTNSFKHAFIEGSDGAGIRIAFSKEGSGSIRFFYSDNGKGIEPEQMTTSDSMGTSLIRDLTRQLNATLEINNQNGLNFMFLIPLK